MRPRPEHNPRQWPKPYCAGCIDTSEAVRVAIAWTGSAQLPHEVLIDHRIVAGSRLTKASFWKYGRAETGSTPPFAPGDKFENVRAIHSHFLCFRVCLDVFRLTTLGAMTAVQFSLPLGR